MAGIYNHQDDEPLTRMEQGPIHNDVEDIPEHRVTTRCQSRRLAPVLVVALVAAACITFFKSTGSPKTANMHAIIGFSVPPCQRPEDFCTKEGLLYEQNDCDGDGVDDHYCEGGGYCGCVKSSRECKNTWPEVCVGGTDTDREQMPHLVPTDDMKRTEKIEAPNGSHGTWFLLVEWTAQLNQTVHAGDTVAIVQPFLPNGEYTPVEHLKSQHDGYVVMMQHIEPGSVVAAGDDLALVSDYPLAKAKGSNIPWVLIGLVCAALFLLCLIMALIAAFIYCIILLCCRRDKEEPEPVIMEEKEEENPLLEDPEPVMAPIFEKPTGVPIYFDDRVSYVKYRPLGIKFYTKAPIKIDHFIFNSYGKTLGLEKGQRLTKIGDEDVHANHKYSDVDHKLLASLEHLPYWPLRVEFKTPEGYTKTFDFVYRDIGIKFSRHLPIKVEKFKAHSYAEELGVGLHWEVTKIADEDITEEHSFSHVDHNLMEGLKHLPNRPKH